MPDHYFKTLLYTFFLIFRLRDMCEQFIGLIGEVPIYNIYKKNPKSKRKLEDYLCRGKGVRGECVPGHAKDEL